MVSHYGWGWGQQECTLIGVAICYIGDASFKCLSEGLYYGVCSLVGQLLGRNCMLELTLQCQTAK